MGTTVLGVWLVAHGVSGLVPFVLPGFGILMALLALVAGILILLGR
jgi:hypothetical protein